MTNSQIGLIVVGVVSLAAIWGIFKNMKSGFGPFNLKVYGITLVLSLTGILVLSGLEFEKVSAAFGIFGTIAGYLFGLEKDNKNSS